MTHSNSIKNSKLKGIHASSGISFGRAFIMTNEELEIPKITINKVVLQNEINRFEGILDKTRSEIISLRNDVAKNLGESEAEIFDAHLLVLEDQALISETIKEVKDTLFNIEFCFHKVCQRYIDFFSSMEDEYLRERVVDIKDVSRRVLSNLMGQVRSELCKWLKNRILVAQDLVPSMALELQKSNVLAFVTELGTSTSHSSIMARTMEMPAVVGCVGVTQKVHLDDYIIVDADEGMVIVNPSENTLSEYREIQKKRNIIQQRFDSSVGQPLKTLDGKRLHLMSNVESVEDISRVNKVNADGIGLYRTETLFLKHRTFPSEETQFNEYRKVVECLEEGAVIIRTLDLGGDKTLDGNKSFHDEINPFLGFRAIRFCLKNQPIFKEQLRAILRASAYGKIKLMYPMISGVDELIKTNKLLDEIKKELLSESIPFDEKIPIGVMVEIPSLVFSIDILAPHCDFFSIGSNDLIQYLFAIDRGNEMVADLYQPTHPSLLRVLKQIIDSAKKHHKEIGICGEIGGDPLFSSLLFGMGIDYLSMSSSRLSEVRYLVQHLLLEDAKKLSETVLKMNDAREIMDCLKTFYSKKMGKVFENS